LKIKYYSRTSSLLFHNYITECSTDTFGGPRHTKLRLYNVYILPVFLYGAETWSITKAIERRINALDHWCLRRILNITWSEHVTNSEIRRRTGQPLLSDIVHDRHLKLFGHVARADKSQDHSRALRACIWHTPKNRKRRLGRPRHTWLRTVEADLRPFNLGLASGFKKAQDRTTSRERLRHRQVLNDGDDDDVTE